MGQGEELIQLNPLRLWKAGAVAARTIPGLTRVMIRNLLINLLIYFGIIVTVGLLFYFYILTPSINWFQNQSNTWISYGGTLLLWLVQIAMLMVMGFFSLRISMKFMEFWYGGMVARVVAHFRDLPEEKTSWRTRISEWASLIKDLAKEVAITLALLLLGLIPFLGAPLVFIIGAHLIGRSLKLPYLELVKSPKEIRRRRNLLLSTFAMGWAQMLLTLIPLLGWLIIPVSAIYQVTGFAYVQEEARKAKEKQMPEAKFT